MTKLSFEDCISLIYILKEMGIRTEHYKEEAKSSEEYLAFDLFTEQIDHLIDKLDKIKAEIISEKYPFN